MAPVVALAVLALLVVAFLVYAAIAVEGGDPVLGRQDDGDQHAGLRRGTAEQGPDHQEAGE